MTLRQRLTVSYIAVALAGILLASLAGAILVRTAQVRSAERSVRLVAALVAPRLDSERVTPDNIRPLLQALNAGGMRVLVVEPDGTVLEDSQGSLAGRQLPLQRSFFDRPLVAPQRFPVRQARVGGERFFFTILPTELDAFPGARVVTALPVATVLDSWLLLLPGALLLGALGVLVAGLLGRRTARQLAAPVEALTLAANRMARGDYEARVEPGSDLAEFRTLGETFNSMATEVQHSRQTQRDFLANVSHDLRTPLTSIQGFSQALMDGAVPPEQVTRVSAIIHGEAARLGRLVQELLDLARIEAGRFSMVQRDITMNQLLERCADKFQAQADALGVEFESTIPRRTLPVHGDADRLEQVMTNLIDNALTHAKQGGGRVSLAASLGGVRNGVSGNGHDGVSDTRSDSLGRWWIEVKVEDNGPGIPDEQKARLFERFYRADSARGTSGLGLGLAIAREIVTAHGGDICVQDAPARGTEFVVRLPMKMR